MSLPQSVRIAAQPGAGTAGLSSSLVSVRGSGLSVTYSRNRGHENAKHPHCTREDGTLAALPMNLSLLEFWKGRPDWLLPPEDPQVAVGWLCTVTSFSAGLAWHLKPLTLGINYK